MIILFHRPKLQSELESTSETNQQQTPKKIRTDTFSVQDLKISQSENTLNIKIQVLYKRMTDLDIEFNLDVVPNTVLELYYNTGGKKSFVRDYTIVNPYIPLSGVPNEETTYVGRVHVLSDGNIVIYIRSHYDNIDGVENVILEEGQSSISAMNEQYPEINQLHKDITTKRDFLNDIDTLDSISYLEAQVDLLTKIILDSGIIKNDEFNEVLQDADTVGIYRYNDKEKLLNKIKDKKAFRKLQLKYYQDIEQQ